MVAFSITPESRPTIKLKQNIWSLDRVIAPSHQISPHCAIDTPPKVLENFCLLLSRDVYSEGDARVLYDYLMSRRAELSQDFLTMLEFWLEDELKHYEALRRTYHCLTGISYPTMDRRFEARIHNFEPIQTLLREEFTILVTLMFDEIGSVYSYRRDLNEYYRYFGSSIEQIAHHLVRDEGTHFGNAAELILLHHSHRLAEVAPLLQKIVALEHSLGKYHQSFFLDHAQEQHRFPPSFNRLIARVVLARLGLERMPKSNELRQLWQWTPVGHSFTPAF